MGAQDAPLRRVKRNLSRLSARTYKNAVPHIYGQKYYYPYGFKEVKNYRKELVTKLYADGPFMAKREAEVRLGELHLDMGDIHESDSRDLNKAKKEIADKLNKEQELPVEVATQRKYRK